MTIDRIIDLLKIEQKCILRNTNNECNRQCGECDLVQDDGELYEMYNDAITALNAQKPRLMALEEISGIPTDTEGNAPVWMETRIMNNKGVLTYFEASILWFVDDGWWRRFDPVRTGWEDRKADTYGITWRCWTSPPDEKTRNETSWNV